MSNRLKISILLLVLAIIFIVRTSPAFGANKKAAPNLKKITSKSTSKRVESEIPKVRSSQNRIPGQLQVHSLGIGIGQTVLMGEFEDNGENGITPDLYYNYSASHSFDLIANLHYSNHKYRRKSISLQGLAIGIKAKLYQFDAFFPFAFTGLGFYRPKVQREVNGHILKSESKLTFGIHAGAGGELRLNEHYSMAILGHYHNPFDVKQEVGPEIQGSYFKLLMAGFYTF